MDFQAKFLKLVEKVEGVALITKAEGCVTDYYVGGTESEFYGYSLNTVKDFNHHIIGDRIVNGVEGWSITVEYDKRGEVKTKTFNDITEEEFMKRF